MAARYCIMAIHTKKKLSFSKCKVRADFGEGDVTKHFSVKKGFLSEKGEAIE